MKPDREDVLLALIIIGAVFACLAVVKLAMTMESARWYVP